jgi:hypothetical protein
MQRAPTTVRTECVGSKDVHLCEEAVIVQNPYLSRQHSQTRAPEGTSKEPKPETVALSIGEKPIPASPTNNINVKAAG